MEFLLSLIDISNLKHDDFNAITFSLMGMAIVFGGLLIISLYIVILPKLLSFAGSLKRKKLSQPSEPEPNELEILLAIGCAFHMHKNFPDADERITWKSHGDIDSPWLVSGRMHSLGVRTRNKAWNKR